MTQRPGDQRPRTGPDADLPDTVVVEMDALAPTMAIEPGDLDAATQRLSAPPPATGAPPRATGLPRPPAPARPSLLPLVVAAGVGALAAAALLLILR